MAARVAFSFFHRVAKSHVERKRDRKTLKEGQPAVYSESEREGLKEGALDQVVYHRLPILLHASG